ncbi:MAG: hypothetical protein COX57_04830 [Alphaproteobacteria bacterium CG_4_10_14_0_2_um_filter_63_37]|nr:MAG: hypothetical protein AUJ55_10040 [Proteobacteria bacterium CG1_02_64_396]PJA25155.1 MAG: hypothetical protein COX57_04830 [Alphaproteobacteria bacterium CG_4_10_14_0_2_um_filter_63_37]
MNHLKLLRRCIVEKQTGFFRFVVDGEARTLRIDGGDLVGGGNDVADLVAAFLLHGKGAMFSPSTDRNTTLTPADQMVSLALSRWTLPPSYRSEMRLFFEAFPRVKVRLVPVHRFGFPHPLAFYSFHRAAMTEEGLDLKRYLNDPGMIEAELDARMAVVLGAYLLGLMTPVASILGSGVVSRIISRIRRMA